MSRPHLRSDGKYASPHSPLNMLARVAWGAAWRLLFRPSPRPLHAWRAMLLRAFGARVGRRVQVMPSVKVWAPWNLRVGDGACISHDVDCYCVAPVTIGRRATVSQYSFLCAATHDPDDSRMPLVAKPIAIGDDAWVCADVFVGPGAAVGAGAVVGARSSVFGELPAWKVCVGTPARPVRDRRATPPATGAGAAEGR